MAIIRVSKTSAEGLLEAERPEQVVIGETGGYFYVLVTTLDAVIERYRWATTHRKIFHRTDDTYWALDYEESDTEEHEPWSYIQPELKQVVPREKLVTVWEVA